MSKKIVNIVSNIRIISDYTSSYINQLLSLSQDNYEIGKIILVCDEISGNTKISNWAAVDSRVILVLEELTDISLLNIEEKTNQWAKLCNQGINESLKFKSDYTFFVEADLTFPFDLLDELVFSNLDICAPVIFLGAGFYDSWGFRDLNGKKIFNLKRCDVFTSPIELSSVGSCVLFRTDIFFSGVRFRGPYDSGLLVGVCNDARILGYRVWMLPHLSIIHPTSSWRKQMWLITEIDIQHLLFTENYKTNIIVPSAYKEFVESAVIKYLGNIKAIPILDCSILIIKNETKRSLSIKILDV